MCGISVNGSTDAYPLKPKTKVEYTSGEKFHISGSGVSQVIVIYNNCGCWFLAQWSAGKVMSAVAGQWPERKYRERHKYVGNRRKGLAPFTYTVKL